MIQLITLDKQKFNIRSEDKSIPLPGIPGLDILTSNLCVWLLTTTTRPPIVTSQGAEKQLCCQLGDREVFYSKKGRTNEENRGCLKIMMFIH